MGDPHKACALPSLPTFAVLFPPPPFAEPILESIVSAQLGCGSFPPRRTVQVPGPTGCLGRVTRLGCGSFMPALMDVQGVHLLHPVQHPLIHERQALALDEPVLQDQATAEERGGREGNSHHEGRLREGQGRTGQV